MSDKLYKIQLLQLALNFAKAKYKNDLHIQLYSKME